jgi:deoxyhypusine monooxygenase
VLCYPFEKLGVFIGQAAEALGAIGLEKSISLLRESLAADPAVEVQETCELALRRIEEQKNAIGVESTTISPYLSVDPALPAKQGLLVEQLRYVFEDSSICAHCLWYTPS